MFPSSSKSCCNNNPWSFTNDENPNISRPEEEEEEEEEEHTLTHTPSSFLHFTSPPFLGNDDDHVLENHHHLFSQHEQQQLLEATQHQQVADEEAEIISTVDDDHDQPRPLSKKRSTSGGGGAGTGKKKKQTQPRKRPTGKKDRHSKIYTAQGPRDRRMRLSLQIARKFFDLQDILGFDKASKTIEWLFTKSKSAIKDLMGTLPQVNPSRCYASECEEEKVSKLTSKKEIMGGKLGVTTSREKNDHQRKSRNNPSSSFHPLSKDCRDKARARARERTREKMIRSLEKSKQSCYDIANPNNYLEQPTGCSSPFEIGEESSSAPSHTDMNSPPIIAAATQTQLVDEPAVVTHLLEHQMATVGIMDKFLGMESSSTLTSPSILKYYPFHTAAESSHGIYSNDDFLAGYHHQGGWGAMENARIQSNYCSITDHIDPNSSSGDIHQQQNPSTGFIITSNLRLHSQFLGN